MKTKQLFESGPLDALILIFLPQSFCQMSLLGSGRDDSMSIDHPGSGVVLPEKNRGEPGKKACKYAW